MELTDELKAFLGETACTLKGSVRRVFMARAVRDLGAGGQRLAERELGWSRVLVRKGRHELDSGITCVDGFAVRAQEGRRPSAAPAHGHHGDRGRSCQRR